MPIGRYFLSVGTALLAVLFLADACFPNSQPDALGRSGRNLDKSIIRITSTKKWPERIDFDTLLPTVRHNRIVERTGSIDCRIARRP